MPRRCGGMGWLGWARAWRAALAGATVALLAACGGGGGGGGGGTAPPDPPAADTRLAWGDAGFQTILQAVPTGTGGGGGGGGGSTPTTLTIH